MLTADARRRLCVVLVGARNPQNIGAAARAMQDFGFSDLRVVNAFEPPFAAAQLEAKSAVGAAEVMHSARRFSDLAEAIQDCRVVVGTTAIGGRALEQTVETLQAVAPRVRATLTNSVEPVSQVHDALDSSREPPTSSVALLFGSEKTGLTREQLSFCTALVTIPLWQPEGRHLSMNLGQAVAVCLYELSREGFEGSRELPSREQAGVSAGDRERLLALLGTVMETSDYARRFPANARSHVQRHLVQALAETPETAATWMGLLKMILRRIEDHPAKNRREP